MKGASFGVVFPQAEKGGETGPRRPTRRRLSRHVIRLKITAMFDPAPLVEPANPKGAALFRAWIAEIKSERAPTQARVTRRMTAEGVSRATAYRTWNTAVRSGYLYRLGRATSPLCAPLARSLRSSNDKMRVRDKAARHQ